MNVISHVSIGVSDVEESVKFYDKIMPLFGAKRQKEVKEEGTLVGKILRFF